MSGRRGNQGVPRAASSCSLRFFVLPAAAAPRLRQTFTGPSSTLSRRLSVLAVAHAAIHHLDGHDARAHSRCGSSLPLHGHGDGHRLEQCLNRGACQWSGLDRIRARARRDPRGGECRRRQRIRREPDNNSDEDIHAFARRPGRDCDYERRSPTRTCVDRRCRALRARRGYRAGRRES